MSREHRGLLIELDIGTSKVMAMVAELHPDGAYEVIGMDQIKLKGLKKGIAVGIGATIQSIQKAFEEVELVTDCRVGEVFVSITGSHIRSFNSSGVVAIKDEEVASTNVAHMIEATKAVNIPTGQQILHILTRELIIDGQEDMRESIGMSGIRLEVEVHIATGAVSAVQNIVKCVRRCGLGMHDLTLQPLALGLAVLIKDKKELGVVLMDASSDTTDIAILNEGTIHYTVVIPITDDQIANDITMALRMPTSDAKNIKIQYGITKQVLVDPGEMTGVPGAGDRSPCTLPCQALAAVIESRARELLSLVHQVVRESGYGELLSSGMVLIDGAAVMSGMVELGEDMSLKPVHMDMSEYRGNLYEVMKSPRCATVMGLLQKGRVQRVRGRKVAMQSGSAGQIWTRMKERFIGNF